MYIVLICVCPQKYMLKADYINGAVHTHYFEVYGAPSFHIVNKQRVAVHT